MKIIKKCESCKKETETTTERIADNRGKYCSRQCQFESMRKGIKVKCSICKNSFIKYKSKKSDRHYCGYICRKIGSSLYDSKRLVNYVKNNTGYFKQKLGKKGTSVSTDGYYWYNDKKVHRLIMEKHLGRKLLPTEIVHHIDFNKLNNEISNLQIVSRSEHNKIHRFLTKKVV